MVSRDNFEVHPEVEYIHLRDQHMTMSLFAREKLSMHLRHRMGVFVSRVKATELMANLPCLTPSDREEIQAKKDFSGNYAAIQLLLDYVQKRMNWPEELISALVVLEHQDLADELRAEWNKHNQNNPSPPSAAVIRAHVHPAPSTSPESSEGSPSSLVLPAQPAPPEVAVPPVEAPPENSPHPKVAPEASPPPVVAAQPEAPPSSVPEAPVAVSSSEPAPQAPEAAVSPEIASEAAPSAVAAPQAEPQAAPSPVSAEEPTVISVPPVSHSEEAASSQPGHIETVSLGDNSSHGDAATQMALSETTPTLPVSDLALSQTESTPTPAALATAQSQTESTPTPAALATAQSPDRRPVQDTSPPTAKVTTFHQEAVEDSDPTQVTEDEQHTEPAQSPPSQLSSPAVDPVNQDDIFFSKPEVLLSEIMDSQPYSGDSTRLQRSVSGLEPATADVTSPVVVPDPVPHPVPTATPLPCRENGVPEEITEPLSHNEPQEDTYESLCLSSLGDQEVLLNVVHVSEDASIQNNDGQTPSMLVQNHNSQSQITPLSGSTDLVLSSGPNQHGQTEDSLGKAVSKSEESPGLIMIGQNTSTKHPDAPPRAPIGSVPIINGSSLAENHHLLEPVMMKTMMEASAVPELKQKQEERGGGGGRGGGGRGSYYLLGAAVVASALFVAWRMKK
ncbi:hypothetical protein J4Q44_G00219560 [Coregonus suidteri]|uniref:Mitochondrial antiviral-signaling protein n=1 Tax=Coregonus suidteri TaxID=861788 RepID=A0AAN8L7X5_9TELE